MAPGTSKVRIYLICLLAVVNLAIPRFGFAQARQESLGALRERAGEAWQARAAGMGNFTLNRAEKMLVSAISRAGKERDWAQVDSLFAKYTGDAPPVYTAALHAAFRCRKYMEGALLFEQCKQRCKGNLDEPVYTQAIRIYGKLGEHAIVREVWDEALAKGFFDAVLASSRIAAAADEGDIETAAQVLDLLESKGIPVNALHVSSAIRSCWGWGQNRHKAATYFYELCPRLGVKPDLIIFTCLIGAFDSAPLEVITSTYRTMRELQVAANIAFAETYLVSVLSKPKELKLQDSQTTSRWLRDKPIERLQAAQEALEDFERDGVKLTALSKRIKVGLKELKL